MSHVTINIAKVSIANSLRVGLTMLMKVTGFHDRLKMKGVHQVALNPLKFNGLKQESMVGMII